ncbi:MAG: chromophore lyase CpcT/CpeT [Phormidesmis sp.]
MPASPLSTLATYLAGEFENQAQAAADPAWYVHLRLWQRPVLSLSNRQTYTLFLEQASVASGKPPYRQRILQLTEAPEQIPGQLRGQYFALADPLRFQGGGCDSALLSDLSAGDLVSLSNSKATIQYRELGQPQGYQFQAALPDGQLCSFEYAGQRKYVYLGFDIAPKQGTIELLTYDKGVEPSTGKGLWGALIGPFQMIKQESYKFDEIAHD